MKEKLLQLLTQYEQTTNAAQQYALLQQCRDIVDEAMETIEDECGIQGDAPVEESLIDSIMQDNT